jgi:hypothetical protein
MVTISGMILCFYNHILAGFLLLGISFMVAVITVVVEILNEVRKRISTRAGFAGRIV